MTRPVCTALLLASLSTLACTKEKTCPSDQRLCGDACALLDGDPRNCGACGHACATGEACRQGQCTDCASACGGGQRCVDGLCVADVYAACYNTDEVRGATADLAPAGVPLPTDSGPVSVTRLGDRLYVANSRSDTLSAISFSPTATSTRGDAALQVISGAAGFADLEYVTAHGGLLWISNSAAGTLVVADPARGVVDEIPLGAAGEYVGPLGIDFVGDRAYVALNGADALAVVDVSAAPTCQPPDPRAPACGPGGACAAPATCVNGLCQRSFCGRVLQRLDLSRLASAGARAGPSRVLAVGSRLFVTLWDLFDASFGRVAGAHGKLALLDVDPATGLGVPSAVDLGAACLNAYGLALSGTTLWVTCGDYDFTSVRGAAFVPVTDLAAPTPTVGAAIPLTHAATEIAFCGGQGYAGASDSGTLMRLDPASGTVQSTLTPLCAPRQAGGASFIPSVACAP